LLPPATAGKRLALAVGIDVYDNLPAHEQLRKAVNDARSMAASLRGLGFDTTVEENIGKLAFSRAWQKLLNRLQPGDTAALFFAGHGVEIGGLNYLLPRDVPKVTPGEDRVLAEHAIRFNTLMDDLRDRKVGVALFIVDACRDNPFRDGRGRSVGGTRGLARIEPAKGSFVMYSAGAGEQALDRLSDADPDPNSVYTRTLLPILATPGLSLPEIAGRVRRKVVEVARGVGREQTPAYYDELLGEFVLKPGDAGAGKRPADAVPASDVERAWVAAKDSTGTAVLEAFRRQYGAANPFYDRLAAERIEALRRRQLAVAEKKRAEAERQPGEMFRDCPDVCPEMVVAPAGSFTMGSPVNEADRTTAEGPQHRVTIAHGFAVGRFEVTFAEWDACVNARGCRHRPGDTGWGRDRRPVINVSWDDVTKEYLPWLSRKTGRSYRLLTEAEWEYAARAGTSTRYSFGDTISKRHAQFSEEGLGSAGRTAKVGPSLANRFGLYDMHGNVWEWVQDCWNDSYSGAPTEGSAWATGDCGRRVLRGGSWLNNPLDLRAASRMGDTPVNRINSIGFRVGRTL
jgi:formylglycine-generating enzyme required for sulfatase activity